MTVKSKDMSRAWSTSADLHREETQESDMLKGVRNEEESIPEVPEQVHKMRDEPQGLREALSQPPNWSGSPECEQEAAECLQRAAMMVGAHIWVLEVRDGA